MQKIRFKINYQVKQKRKFEDFLARYQQEIQFEFKELKIEKYRKIDHQFQANFYIETGFMEKEKIVYQILTFANKLWPCGYSNWTFHGPHENDVLTFECFLNNQQDDQPLKWAHIEIEHE